MNHFNRTLQPILSSSTLKLAMWIIWGFAIISQNSCSPSEPSLTRLDDIHFRWFAFDTGTHWIYEEVNSAQLDSFWVYKNEILTAFSDEATEQEILYVYFTNQTRDTFSMVTNLGHVSLRLRNGPYNPEVSYETIICNEIPPVSGSAKSRTYPFGRVIRTDTAFIGDNDRFNWVMSDNFNLVFNNQSSVIKLEENVGMTEIHFPDSGVTWRLIRSEIKTIEVST